MRRRDHEVVAQLSDLARFSFFFVSSSLFFHSFVFLNTIHCRVFSALHRIALSSCPFLPGRVALSPTYSYFFFVGSVFPISHTTHQFPTASKRMGGREEWNWEEEEKKKSSLQLPRLVVMNSGAADEERKKKHTNEEKKVVCYSLLDCAVWLSYEYRVRYSLFHDENSAKQQVSLHNT